MVYQIHIDYVKKYHYIAIVSLIREKENIEFIQESKGSHKQEIILFKIEFCLKNVSQEICKPLGYVIIAHI